MLDVLFYISRILQDYFWEKVKDKVIGFRKLDIVEGIQSENRGIIGNVI